MTEKDLKWLNRSELLELLLVQTQETERLKSDLEAARAQLAERELRLEKAGDLAQAALAVNGVMEAAQAAAQQYLDNIARMERETAEKCEKMLLRARQELDRARKLSGADVPEISDQELIGQIRQLLDGQLS